MKQQLLWKLLIGNIIPIIAIIILVVWLAIDKLASEYFTVLMKQYHIDPAESHRMFITAIHKYLIWASFAALSLALMLSYLLTRRVLRPLFQMTAITRQIANGNYADRVEILSSDEVGQLAESFNDMADNLEKVEQLRKNMVADIAHELRTPLTNLRGYMEALSDAVIPPSRDTFQMLEQESLRLVNLVEDLQQLARADAAKAFLSIQEIPLNEMLGQIVDLYRPKFQEKAISVNWQQTSESIRVHVDRDKLLQAIRNLVDNAWKYTPVNGSVSITTIRNQGGIKTIFSNTSDGIAEKDISLIFERFFRADRSRSRDVGGAGIGLAIVKELVEAHGGTVGAESDETSTQVWFSLPA